MNKIKKILDILSESAAAVILHNIELIKKGEK